MSIRRSASRFLDSLAAARVRLVSRERRARLHFCPVLHVEQLDKDSCFESLLTYLEAYRRVTGRRAVATVMTPLSPLTAARLAASGFGEEKYAERIAGVGRWAIIGQHGHYLRPAPGGELRPMHASFFDGAAIERQIAAEADWLISRGLMDPERKIYSAGWWFMNSWLQRTIARLGYRHDFSLSVSQQSYSHAAWIERKRSGVLGQAIRFGHEGGQMTGAVALSATAGPGRPLICLKRLVAERLLPPGGRTSPLYLTFYGHDYDLPARDAISATARLAEMGFGFFEPEDLDSAAAQTESAG
jgi:hypothetical protein